MTARRRARATHGVSTGALPGEQAKSRSQQAAPANRTPSASPAPRRSSIREGDAMMRRLADLAVSRRLPAACCLPTRPATRHPDGAATSAPRSETQVPGAQRLVRSHSAPRPHSASASNLPVLRSRRRHWRWQALRRCRLSLIVLPRQQMQCASPVCRADRARAIACAFGSSATRRQCRLQHRRRLPVCICPADSAGGLPCPHRFATRQSDRIVISGAPMPWATTRSTSRSPGESVRPQLPARPGPHLAAVISIDAARAAAASWRPTRRKTADRGTGASRSRSSPREGG